MNGISFYAREQKVNIVKWFCMADSAEEWIVRYALTDQPVSISLECSIFFLIFGNFILF